MKVTVSIEIDTDQISTYRDSYIASLWHVAQANPVDGMEHPEPGRLAEAIGREIIRRFLRATPPELYNHQGHHFDWARHALKKADTAEQAGVAS